MRGAVDDRRVHYLPGAVRRSGVLERGEHADDEVERAARVVTEQIGREGGRLVGLADHGRARR